LEPEIQIGMRVVLFIPSTSKYDEEKGLALPSIVEKIQGEEYIYIQMPTYHGYYYPLPRETILLRCFFDSMPYSLEVRYEEMVENEGFMLAKMKRLSPIKEHQMRESYRLKCMIPVTIERTSNKRSADNDHVSENSEWDGFTIDLSEGGMLLSTNEFLQEGESIIVSLDLGGQESLESRVLRVEEVPKAKYRFKAALQFEHQQQQQTQRIYRYIVRVQVEHMKRE